jgi:hypothetical protein
MAKTQTEMILDPRNWKPDHAKIAEKRGISSQASWQWWERNKDNFRIEVRRIK